MKKDNTYPLSPSRLSLYNQCARAYYNRYELGIKSAFGSTDLGKAVHAALKDIYGEWNYGHPKPSLEWFKLCWEPCTGKLTQKQVDLGWDMLKLYYEKLVEPSPTFSKPLGTERLVQGSISVGGIDFTVRGQYDRLDYISSGLELIDYKTTVDTSPPDPVNIQLGVYDELLQQIYGEALTKLSLIYMRTGEKYSYDVTPEHRQESRKLIEQLALQLRCDEEWQPKKGHHCNICTSRKHCDLVTEKPEPLPKTLEEPRDVQLVLQL